MEPVPFVGDTLDESALWLCRTCRACVEVCPAMIEHVDQIIEVRRSEVMMNGRLPADAKNALKAIETRINLADEDVIVGDDEAKLMDMREQLRLENQQEAMDQMAQLQEALGVTELLKAIQEIDDRAAQGLPDKIRQVASHLLEQEEWQR